MIESAEQFVRLRSSEDKADTDLAVRGEASMDVWEEVIDRYPEMTFWVAQNKTVPIEILERLVEDPSPDVRLMVAMKGKATPSMLRALSTDGNDAVRAAVARHRRTPSSVLAELAGTDPWPEVRRIARERMASADA